MNSPDQMGKTFENPNLDQIQITPEIHLPNAQEDKKNTQVRQLLKNDSYLAYLSEDEQSYQVRGRDGNIITIAKDRSPDGVIPTQKSKTVREAFLWLTMALIGLSFSGLGSILFAPVAILKTMQQSRRPTGQPDQVRRRVVQAAAILLLIPAVLLVYLFWLHLRL